MIEAVVLHRKDNDFTRLDVVTPPTVDAVRRRRYEIEAELGMPIESGQVATGSVVLIDSGEISAIREDSPLEFTV